MNFITYHQRLPMLYGIILIVGWGLMYAVLDNHLINSPDPESSFLPTRYTIELVILSCLFIASFTVIFLGSRFFRRRLHTISDNLMEHAEQVEGASGELVDVSLATLQSAQEQDQHVISMHDGISKLQQFVKDNAEKIPQAEQAMIAATKEIDQTQRLAGNLQDLMQQMTNVINKMQDVIKTIESIGFQTGLLAVSASIEAARAGEAGVGLSTVAEEVRDLATKSAAAAQSTNELTHQATLLSEHGVASISQVHATLMTILSTAQQVSDDLKASGQQAHQQQERVDEVQHVITNMEHTSLDHTESADTSNQAVQTLPDRAHALQTMIAELPSGESVNIFKLITSVIFYECYYSSLTLAGK